MVTEKLSYFLCVFLAVRPFLKYLGHGHLSRSRSNMKVTFEKKKKKKEKPL